MENRSQTSAVFDGIVIRETGGKVHTLSLTT
jgi:hypothetical protein